MTDYLLDAYRQTVSAFLPRNEHALIEDAEALFDLLRRYGIAVYAAEERIAAETESSLSSRK
ncbi:hypothetical protein J19TS2_50760 [Cohnella xylanilytica]|uniref:hypothetical protein n=1 Tax=Cohnella xylanilytica TaxID=557555 RepID=UPI001B2ED0EA|nr:hypothetical protein [Cohnella xylanilytica]GIO15521.1 hypothetical protein J19TS2_50760 [Cohnella xylanilytica]